MNKSFETQKTGFSDHVGKPKRSVFYREEFVNTKTYIRSAGLRFVSRIRKTTVAAFLVAAAMAAVFSGFSDNIKAKAFTDGEYPDKPELVSYLERPQKLHKTKKNLPKTDNASEYPEATEYEKFCLGMYMMNRSVEVKATGVATVEKMTEQELLAKQEEQKKEELRLLAEENSKKNRSSGAPTAVFNENMLMEPGDEEMEMLYRIVEAEATGEKIIGKILVANVVLNRVINKSFPNSIEGVIFQHSGNSYQFSPISDGRYYTVSVTDSTKEAVARALSGEDYSKGALFFFERARTSDEKAAWFDTLNFKLSYGCHEFFR